DAPARRWRRSGRGPRAPGPGWPGSHPRRLSVHSMSSLRPLSARFLTRFSLSPIPRVPIPRNGLEHAHAVALGVPERDVLSDAGYRHRLAKHFTACFRYSLHRFCDVVHRDDDGRMLVGPAGFLRKESSVDRTGFPGTVVVGFGGGGKNVMTHVLTELLRVPAE